MNENWVVSNYVTPDEISLFIKWRELTTSDVSFELNLIREEWLTCGMRKFVLKLNMKERSSLDVRALPKTFMVYAMKFEIRGRRG